MQLEQIEQAFKDNEKVTGHLSYLDEMRLVFIGEHAEYKDSWFVGFRNEEGEDTRLRLSKEAMAVLVQLYNKPQKGDAIFPLRIRTAWQVTVRDRGEEQSSNKPVEEKP